MKRQWPRRALLGGLIAVGAALALILLLNLLVNSITWLGGAPGYTDIQLTTDRSAWYFGSQSLAAAVELLSVFALGAAAGIATLPFAGEGKKLALLSLAHFAVTGALAQLVGWSYQWLGMGPDDGPRIVLAFYAAVYVLIWCIRWVFWCAELRKIRAKLGLTQKQGGGDSV